MIFNKLSLLSFPQKKKKKKTSNNKVTFSSYLYRIVMGCILHQSRHVRMLTWLDPNPIRGIAMSKGRETLAEEGDLWLLRPP